MLRRGGRGKGLLEGGVSLMIADPDKSGSQGEFEDNIEGTPYVIENQLQGVRASSEEEK